MGGKESDWRLTDQEQYLQGAVFHRAVYKKPRKDWDHDHCAFCWATFREEEVPDILHQGYATSDLYYWVCPTCFNDFQEQFAFGRGDGPA